MATVKQIKAYREIQARESAAYLKSLGYESPIFTAKFKGGKCRCGLTISQGALVAYFQGQLSHTPCIDAAIRERDNCKTCKGAHLVMVNDTVEHCPDCK